MEISEEEFTKLIETALVKAKPSLIGRYEVKSHDFEDALQSALIRAWNKKDSLKDIKIFSTWFYAILRNEIVTLLFKKNKIEKSEILYNDLSNSIKNSDNSSDFTEIFPHNPFLENLDTPSHILENKEKLEKTKKILEKTLSTLDPNHSQVLKMVFQDEKSYKQVAQELNLPLGTVMSRVYYARQYARKVYGKSNL